MTAHQSAIMIGLTEHSTKPLNILFLAFEGEAKSMGALAARFKAAGHRVFVASCDHFNVTHSKGEVFDYYRSRGLTDAEFTHLDSVFREVNSLPIDMPDDAVDWGYLRNFEKKYGKRFTLLRLAAMDTLMLRVYHHRNIYFHPRNKALFFKNLELHLRWVESLFSRMPVDLVYTVGNQYFHKAAAYAIADARRIPFLVIAICRIENLHLVYDNFFVGTPRSVLNEMQRLVSANDPCAEASRYVAHLKRTGNASYTENAPIGANLTAGLSLKRRLFEFYWFVTRQWKSVLFVQKHYRGLFRRNYFLPSWRSHLRLLLVSLWRRIAYFGRPELNRTELPTGPFVYFPLHVLPENSVITVAETIDELECLFQLSKTLPPDWSIVVKVNPTMLYDLDTHPNSYYLEMNRLPNVRFVSPLMSSGAILRGAAAVACISGTALLEAAIHGKPAIRWGSPEFEVIDTITKFEPAAVREALGKGASSNLLPYVQACFNLGIRLELATINGDVSRTPTEAEKAAFDAQIGSLERSIYSYLREQRGQDVASANARHGVAASLAS